MFDPEKPKVKKKVEWKRIGRLFLPYWRQEAFVMACILVIALLGLMPPLFTMWLIDRAIPSENFQLVALIAIAMAASAIISALVGVFQGYQNSQVSEGIMRDLRSTLMAHMHKMPLDFFTRTKTGEIMNRVSNDVDTLSNVIAFTLVSIVTNFFTITTTIVTIFVLDWRLSVLSIMLLPLMIAPMWPVGRRMYETRKVTRQKRDELHAITQETLSVSGILLLKSFGRETYERDRYYSLGTDLMSTEIKLAMVGRWFLAFVAAMVTVGPACIWLFGGWLCIKQGLTVGVVVTFVALLARLYTPASALAGVQIQVVSALAVFERIFEYLDMDEEPFEEHDKITLTSIEGHIAFDEVSFAYPNGRSALENISFTAEAGQVVALVGPSGAGKTTVSMLVPRFYNPQEGSVRIDGKDVRDIRLNSLRDHIGIVTQETYLFHDTILSNLKYANPQAGLDEVIAACKAANIHRFIDNLPEKYETIVGERGHQLSGGERQRLAIARVLLKNPKILILDEATSSLDSENEALIQEAMVPLMEGRTSLVIAHRLSTVLSADHIVVLDHGRLVDAGKHENLLARDGLYARLYKQQFKETAAV